MKNNGQRFGRFRIRHKLMLLTAALSVALIFVAVFTTNRLFTQKAQNDAMEDCLDSANSTAGIFEKNYISFFIEYRSMIESIYDENLAELESRAGPGASFASFEERKEYYDSLIAGLFPPEGAFGATFQNIERKMNYMASVQYLGLVKMTNEAERGFAFFYDAGRGNIVHLIDGPYDETGAAGEEALNGYCFPCEIEKPGEKLNEVLLSGETPAAFYDDGLFYALSPVKDPATGETVAYVCYGQYSEKLMESVHGYTRSTLYLMLAATLVLALFYLAFADILIVRNIKKLARSAESFATELENGEKPVPVPSGVETGDEIGELASKFGLMQNAIVDYAGTLAEKTAAEEKLNAELGVASRIQKEALPEGGMRFGDLRITSFLHPAKEVGGDFYDYFPLDEDRLFFYIADVSGKGVPAALFMMMTKEMIKARVLADSDLSKLARDINEELCRNNAEALFITAFFAIYDKRTGRLAFLRGGHEKPFLKHGGRTEQIAEEANFILGAFENMTYESDEITLEPGDVLLLFTDGLNEGINTAEEEFGYGRIAGVMDSCSGDYTQSLYSSLCGFAGETEQFDDVTMLCASVADTLKIELNDPGYDDIPAVCDRVEEHFGPFDPECASELGIIIDELLNNCISYAFEGVPSPYVSLAFSYAEGTLELTLTDNGAAFDPLAVEDASYGDTDGGGNGITIVRSLSDMVAYRRVDGYNRLCVTKNMQKSKASEIPE